MGTGLAIRGRVSARACGMCSVVPVDKLELLKAFNSRAFYDGFKQAIRGLPYPDLAGYVAQGELENLNECYNQQCLRNLMDCGLAFLEAQSQFKAFIPANKVEYTRIIMPEFALLLKKSIGNAEFSMTWPTFAICMASVIVYFETYLYPTNTYDEQLIVFLNVYARCLQELQPLI